jgi:amyloid beta precursor protein binding protein 1
MARYFRFHADGSMLFHTHGRWGHFLQKRLAEAHVCVLNAGPTGSETLKNLVLPGCGRFTLVDAKIVDESDLGNNFFLDASWLGRPRAEAVCSLLCEMNPDVVGLSCVARMEDILEKDPAFFQSFTLVVATQLPAAQLAALESVLASHEIPLVVRVILFFTRNA